MSIFSLHHVSGTLKLTKIGLKCLTSLGMKPILFGNEGKIFPGIVPYEVGGSLHIIVIILLAVNVLKVNTGVTQNRIYCMLLYARRQPVLSIWRSR